MLSQSLLNTANKHLLWTFSFWFCSPHQPYAFQRTVWLFMSLLTKPTCSIKHQLCRKLKLLYSTQLTFTDVLACDIPYLVNTTQLLTTSPFTEARYTPMEKNISYRISNYFSQTSTTSHLTRIWSCQYSHLKLTGKALLSYSMHSTETQKPILKTHQVQIMSLLKEKKNL